MGVVALEKSAGGESRVERQDRMCGVVGSDLARKSADGSEGLNTISWHRCS